jgi:hypothetical protein
MEAVTALLKQLGVPRCTSTETGRLFTPWWFWSSTAFAAVFRGFIFHIVDLKALQRRMFCRTSRVFHCLTVISVRNGVTYWRRIVLDNKPL